MDTHPHGTSKESINIDGKLEVESIYKEPKLMLESMKTDTKFLVSIC